MMRRLQSRLLVFGFSLLVSMAAVCGSINEYLQQATERLGSERLALLEQADSGGYKVRILSGVVEGRLRHVVLLGELHVKGEQAGRLGRQLLSVFPFRGLESFYIRGGWARALASPIMTMARGVLKIAGPIIGLTEFSTIDEAVHWGAGDNGEEEPDDNCIQIIYSEQGERITNIYLERDFRESDSLIAHVLMGGVLLAPAIPLAGLFTDYFSSGLSYWSGTLFSWYASAQVLALLLATAQTDDGVRDSALAHMPWTFPLVFFGLHKRNQLMTASIIRAFQACPDEDLMLVVVGKAHVPGMTGLLTDDYGFKIIGGPQLQPSSEPQSDPQH